MAVVTAAISVISALSELNDLIGSQDPLIIRINNLSRDIGVKFGTVTGLKSMEAHAMPTPWIAPGTSSDGHFGASSWTSAEICVEYWFDANGKAYNLYLHYLWVSKHEAHYTFRLGTNTAPGAPMTTVSEIRGDAYRTSTLEGEGFDFHIHASGKLIEISMTQHG